MTAALTPALALAYLSELSADIRAAIVLDAGGEALAVTRSADARAADGGDAGAGRGDAGAGRGDAGAVRGGVPARDAALAEAARALLAHAPVVRALTGRGGAFGARDDRHGVVVVTGPLALPNLVVHDLLSVLAALGGTPRHAGVFDVSDAAAQALLDAL